jgi:preprotein translocase subunit YajC
MPLLSLLLLLLLLLMLVLVFIHTKQEQERFKNFEQGHHQFMEGIETLKKNVRAMYAHYQNISAKNSQ